MEKIHEERLVALESKLAHQDYLLDVLNQTVYRQQKQIDQLNSLISVLAKRMENLTLNPIGDRNSDERPPHY